MAIRVGQAEALKVVVDVHTGGLLSDIYLSLRPPFRVLCAANESGTDVGGGRAI
jgi:hypothetical protein